MVAASLDRLHLPSPSECTASRHAVLALPSSIRDGLPATPSDEQPTRLPSGGQVVHVYMALGSTVVTHKTSQRIRRKSLFTYVAPTVPVCLKCLPTAKTAGGRSHGPPFARMLSTSRFAAASWMNLTMNIGQSSCANLAVLPLKTGLLMQRSMPHYRLSLLTCHFRRRSGPSSPPSSSTCNPLSSLPSPSTWLGPCQHNLPPQTPSTSLVSARALTLPSLSGQKIGF